MSDLRPPKLQADELATLHALLQYTRESLVRKVEGVSDDDAPPAVRRFRHHAALAAEARADGRDALGVRRFADDGTVVPVTRWWRATPWSMRSPPTARRGRRSTPLCSRRHHSTRCVAVPVPGDPPVNLRWVLAHLVEETARHAGHADILRELLDGSTGR